MLKQVRDTKVLESIATLAASGHGKNLISVLKEELEAVKDFLVDSEDMKTSELRGRAKALRELLLLLDSAEDAAERLKQRQ